MSHTIYAAKFEQTIIHQHVHLRRAEEHIKNHIIIVHEAPLTAVGNNILSSMDQTQAKIYQIFSATYKLYSNKTSFFRFANKRAIYWLGIFMEARMCFEF
jgi:hypothetical protein